MYNAPSINELIAAVQTFLTETAGPGLEGRAKFQARIAANILATVQRELAQRPAAEAEEIKRLQALLENHQTTDANALNTQLSERIAKGDTTLATSGLLSHLKKTAIAQLNIDQPTYSGLRVALEDPE